MTRHQLHVRITASEYKFLTDLAQHSEESMATLVRRLIRATMQSRERLKSTGHAGAAAPPLIQQIYRGPALPD